MTRSPAPPPAPTHHLAPGMPVVITGGMSKGARGIIVERWSDIGGAPHWRIDLPDCRDRIIRADFLRPAVDA